MKKLLLLLPFLLFGCKNQPTVTASDVSLMLASVPAHVCIHVNNSRPEILRQAGEAILQQAEQEDWPRERRLEAITRLHESDDRLRAIVSPSFVEGSEERTGACRRVTELLERLSTTVENWEDLDDIRWQTVVTDALRIVEDIRDTLQAMGVADLTAALNNLTEIGGTGLGDHLTSFIDLCERLLDGGIESLLEGARNE